MIILGDYSDRMIGKELLADNREQLTVFCGVPRQGVKQVFESTAKHACFNRFIEAVYNRSYDDGAYESERREIIGGYTAAILDALDVAVPMEIVSRVATMLGDDALAYYVARAAGCAYAPMNGASMNLGPRGRLFDHSREHAQAIRSGGPCFFRFTLLQFHGDERLSAGDPFPRGARGHGYEIGNNFKHHGLMISHVRVCGEPQAGDTEVHRVETDLVIRVPHHTRVSRLFSVRRVIGPRAYN